MPERQYSLKALLDRIKDLPGREVMREVTASHQTAFGYIARGKRKPLHDLAAAHHQETGRLLFFLQNPTMKPFGISSREIALYREFFAYQVARGACPEALLEELATWKGEAPEDLLEE